MGRRFLKHGAWAVAGLWLLAGCGGGSGESVGGTVDSNLVGTWVLVEITAYGGPWPPGSIGWALQVTFRENGTYMMTETWQGSTESWGGRWGVDGNRLTLSEDGTGTYAVTGNQLIFDTADYDGEGTPGILRFQRS